jgi:DNA-binding NarL/FixJ family response regulator
MILTPPSIRAALGTRSALTASLLQTLLMHGGIHVICQSNRLDQLGALVRAEEPDLVILEVVSVSPETTNLIAEIAEIAPLLVLSKSVAPGGVVAAMEAGASGFLSLELGCSELIGAIGAIRRGETPLDPRAAAVLLAQWRGLRLDAAQPTEGSGRLTTREREVLTRMAQGDTTKGVARGLGVAVKTVENHKTRIFTKLGVRSQAEAVAVAMGSGLITGDPEGSRLG